MHVCACVCARAGLRASWLTLPSCLRSLKDTSGNTVIDVEAPAHQQTRFKMDTPEGERVLTNRLRIELAPEDFPGSAGGADWAAVSRLELDRAGDIGIELVSPEEAEAMRWRVDTVRLRRLC